MTVLMLALLAVLLAGAPGNRAYASCNAVPEQPVVFHGVRGSINRAFVTTGDDVVLQMDRRKTDLQSDTGLTADNSLIAITFRPTAGPAKAFFIAGDDKCEELEEPVCFLKRLFCPPPKACFKASDVKLTFEKSLGRIAFRFPKTDFAGPVTIAVGNRGRAEKNLRALSRELQNSCTALFPPKTATEVRSNVTICIDKFVDHPEDDPPGDPKFTELVSIPPPYDYSTVCTHAEGDPQCTPSARGVQYAVTDSGDVQMHVLWNRILKSLGGQKFAKRNLLASTAVEAVRCTPGPGCTPGPDRIRIPSSAFLQTSNGQGGPFTVTPAFVPMDPQNPNEQTFSGTADQGESVLTFKARVQWDHECSGGGDNPLACEQDSDCPQTNPQCITRTPAAYFACDGGSRDKRPCTRSIQCPDQGTGCRLVSKIKNWCVVRDGTWTQVTCGQDSDCGTTCGQGNVCVASDGTPTGPPCSLNGDCGVCGPGLFEFRNRVDAKGYGTLPRIALKMRGVCDNNPGTLCMNNSDCSGGGNCVVFRAAAGTYVPTPTP